MRLAWRCLLPPKRSWLGLLCAPSSYPLLFAFLVTAAAKISILCDIRTLSAWPLWVPVTLAADAALFVGVAALFAVWEGHSRWAVALTTPLAVATAALALANATYLSITGQQLSWYAVEIGLARLDDVALIAGEGARARGRELVLGGMLAAAVPAAALWLLARRGEPADPRATALGRAHAAAAVAALAALVSALMPRPDDHVAERLTRNGLAQTYLGYVGDAELEEVPVSAPFAGYHPRELVAPAAVAALAARERPNLLVVVLESARWDHTSLAGEAAFADTPNLAALAARGATVVAARAAVTHTTKSLFSIFCARFPLAQPEYLEASADPGIDVECLPDILGAAGYETAFFQSAMGSFEERPRLVSNLGFAHFEAREDIGGEETGYLSSDDESLAPRVGEWMAAAREPFLAAVLTSAAHHPYRLPRGVAERAAREGRRAGTDAERYARLVEAGDHLLGALLAELERSGRRQRTIVVVLGDHGEGFGERGVRQHDGNFFEEGLRVPWVMAGPGVPVAAIAGAASLVDVTPSLLALLGLEMTPAASQASPGFDVLAGLPDRPRFFACWYPDSCRGYIRGHDKVVFSVDERSAFSYDLAADPEERLPRPLTPELRAALPELHALIDSHRDRGRPMILGAVDIGAWHCAAGERCRHRSRAAAER